MSTTIVSDSYMVLQPRARAVSSPLAGAPLCRGERPSPWGRVAPYGFTAYMCDPETRRTAGENESLGQAGISCAYGSGRGEKNDGSAKLGHGPVSPS